jgi:hypothetical protein
LPSASILCTKEDLKFKALFGSDRDPYKSFFVAPASYFTSTLVKISSESRTSAGSSSKETIYISSCATKSP